MSTDVEAQITDLRRRVTAAQRARVRAEHACDAATAAVKAARTQLAEEFDVHTAEDAKTRLADQQAELDAALAALRAALDEIGV